MPTKNLLITNVPAGWNSTYAIIVVAWEKRKVLNAIAKTCLKDAKGIYLIMSENWNFLKILVDELLAFQEATKLFSKSSS